MAGKNDGGLWLAKKMTKDGQPYFTGKIEGRSFTAFINRDNITRNEAGEVFVKLCETKKPLISLYGFKDAQGSTTFDKPNQDARVSQAVQPTERYTDIPF